MKALDRAIIDCRDRLRSLRGERIRIENDLAQNTAAIERELNRVADLTRRLVSPERKMKAQGKTFKYALRLVKDKQGKVHWRD